MNTCTYKRKKSETLIVVDKKTDLIKPTGCTC